MMEFTNIGKNIPFFNRIMRSDLKFVLKDKWAINLDSNTATLVVVDSQRNFHMELELQDQHNNEAEYSFSDDDEDNDTTTEGMYATSNNNIADNISRNKE